MPYPNEHAARIKDPKKYTAFRRTNNYLGKGIHVIFGIKQENSSEIQAIRFSKSQFTVSKAKSWLKKHHFKPILFEAAQQNTPPK